MAMPVASGAETRGKRLSGGQRLATKRKRSPGRRNGGRAKTAGGLLKGMTEIMSGIVMSKDQR